MGVCVLSLRQFSLLLSAMKRVIYTLLCCTLMGVSVTAQEIKTIKTDTLHVGLQPQIGMAEVKDNPSVAVCPDESVLDLKPVHDEQRPDTLHLPLLNSYGQMPICVYPNSWAGLWDWQLHEGLNVNMGLSVAGAFGKNAPHGAAFAQNVAAMYAVPLTSKLSLAIGGYFSNVYWGRETSCDGGFNAVMGYRFNERWEAYLYGQKSIAKRKMPPLLYDMNGLGDRIGAAVKYNFSPSFSVQVSFEERKH